MRRTAGFAAVVFFGGAGAWLVARHNAPPMRELAAVYGSPRRLELRMEGAEFSSLAGREARSAEELREFEGRVRLAVRKNPEDAAWLHAEGRVALLEMDGESAIRSFQAAADLGASSPEFLVDFGSAFFERAEQAGSPLDYARALEKTDLALRQQPGYLPGLFNHGVLSGRLFQYDIAIGDFEQYLRVEQDKDWKAEAQRRLAELKTRRARVFEGNGGVPPELRTEVAFENAMTGGILAARGAPDADLANEARAMVAEHEDPWLLETMAQGSSPTFERAVETLTGFAKLRQVGSVDYSRFEAGMARLEKQDLPPALRSWRDYELLARRTRTTAVEHCPDLAGVLRGSQRYPWFEAQLLFESSLCAAGRKDFAGAFAQVDEAQRVISRYHLGVSALRVPIFRGQRLVDTGFYNEGAQAALEGLSMLEKGGLPLRRGYDFHVMIVKSAGALGLPAAAFGSAGMMSSIARAAGMKLFEMIGESRKAQFALLLGREEVAGQAYGAAVRVFGELGENAVARTYWRVARAGWLELSGDRETLYRMLAEARVEGSQGRDTLYFNRRLIAAICRLEVAGGRSARVEELSATFWREIEEAAAHSPGSLIAYRPEIESVSESLAMARILAGQPKQALEGWRRFIDFDSRLLGEQSGAGERLPMGPDTMVVTFASLGGRLATWTTTPKGVEFRWCAWPFSELAARVRLLRRLASLREAAEARVADEARKIYGVLFPGGTGNVGTVYVEARGELNALPLSAFSYVAGKGHQAFAFLPFGGQIAGAERAGRATVLAATVFSPKLGNLPPLPSMAGEELEAAEGAFAEHRLLSGSAVTARTVETSVLENGTLHFSGHAIPWRGGIGLVVAPDPEDGSEDGRKGVWSMSRPRSIARELMVFSACNTAEYEDTGTVRPGQLPQAALLSGAQEAVASLWDVDAEATAAWMKVFYGTLAQGKAAPFAVKAAETALRASERWKHPHYWAAFADYSRRIR